MKGYGIPKTWLANAKSLYDTFALLENFGKLGVGNYDSLRQMVKSSGLDELLPKINETDNEIKKLRAVSEAKQSRVDAGESTGHIAQKRQLDHLTGDARLPVISHMVSIVSTTVEVSINLLPGLMQSCHEITGIQTAFDGFLNANGLEMTKNELFNFRKKYTLNVFFLGSSFKDFEPPLHSSEAVKFLRIKKSCLHTELEQTRPDNEALILVSRSLTENETEVILSDCKPFFQSCFLTTDDLLQGVTGSDNAEGKPSLRVEQNLKNMLEKMLERIAFQSARATVNALVYLSNMIKEEKLITYLELNKNNMRISSECTDDIVLMSKKLRENAQPIRELLEESRCMFKRSRIPDDEKPVFPNKPQRTKSNVLQQLLKFGGVICCGDKFGTLMILMDEKLKLKDRTEKEKEIRTFLESKYVKHFQFSYISPEMNHLYKCGHKVFESPASGTLGCFVHNIGGPTRPYDIYALISRHVAMSQVADDFVIDGCDVGKVLSPMVGFHDIAVAGMHNSQLPWVDDKFKTETRDDKRCHVFDFKDDDDETLDYLSGLPVHIWGASSSPGVGRIAIEHCVSYGIGGQICTGIILEDRRYLKKPFSKPGDSGSIICSFNSRNDSLFALGMVCGEYNKQGTDPKQRIVDQALPVSERHRKTKETGQYYALRIDKGLKQLSENHGGRFVLKDDIPILGEENQNSALDNTSTTLPRINADISEEISSNDNSIQRAEDDPHWTRDSEGRGRYDTRGKKGYLLIVNYSANRTGSTRDVEILQSFFKEVDFEVDVASDLTLRELEQRFTDVKQRLNDTIAKENLYCFVCAIMSHGNKDGIATADGKLISEETIRERFNNNYMPNFTGKPKVFLIQACRGTDLQDGEQVEDDDISDVTAMNNDVIEDDIIVTVPNDADTLIAFSSTPGYKSTRMTVSGRCFIPTCVEVFRQSYRTDHLEDMLFTVRERVAQKEREHSQKQMPCVCTSLTKRLFFKKTS